MAQNGGKESQIAKARERSVAQLLSVAATFSGENAIALKEYVPVHEDHRVLSPVDIRDFSRSAFAKKKVEAVRSDGMNEISR